MVVNQAYPSFKNRSHEITLTVPKLNINARLGGGSSNYNSPCPNLMNLSHVLNPPKTGFN